MTMKPKIKLIDGEWTVLAGFDTDRMLVHCALTYCMERNRRHNAIVIYP